MRVTKSERASQTWNEKSTILVERSARYAVAANSKQRTKRLPKTGYENSLNRVMIIDINKPNNNNNKSHSQYNSLRKYIV